MVICDDTILVVQNCTADIDGKGIQHKRLKLSNSRASCSLGNRQNTLQQLSYGTASPLRGFAACAFPASPYVAIKRASRVSLVVSVSSRNPRSLFILHRKGFLHCPQPFTADIVSSTMVICGCFNPHSNNYRMVPLRRFAASRRVRSQRPHMHDASNKN